MEKSSAWGILIVVTLLAVALVYLLARPRPAVATGPAGTNSWDAMIAAIDAGADLYSAA